MPIVVTSISTMRREHIRAGIIRPVVGILPIRQGLNYLTDFESLNIGQEPGFQVLKGIAGPPPDQCLFGKLMCIRGS